MKVDVTTIFFNSVIPEATATAPWCVSIGQGKEKKINASIDGLQDILDGLIYKAVREQGFVDLSAGSKNNEYLLLSKFDKVFVNGSQINNLQMVVALVREHTKSHEGRLRISLPPYAKFDDGEIRFSNEQSYQAISEFLGCGNIYDGGCWFVDDISVHDQDELHFSCVVVNQNERMSYRTSQLRSAEWQGLVPEEHNYVRIPCISQSTDTLQQIYYGAPGTGKSFTIDDKTDDGNSVRITFHPDSDYASFVGAYKPTMENVPINSIYGESVQFATGKNGHPGTEKKIVYKYVPQAFLKAYVAAWSNLDTPYFLIIEEINRGNCAQIFGDLFQLLDRNNAGSSSYAIHADEDITQFLSDDDKGFASLSDDQKDAIRAFVLHKDNGKTQAVGQDILNGKLLLLPPNLYIWATMNTSDQSLFPIDSAFKRRWNWKYMPIEYHPIDKKTQQPIDWKFQIGDNIYSWGQFLSKINPEIYTLTESSDKQLGYFFAKADNATGIISEDVFLNKVLFYLWTDVFKDFDVSSELFKNKKANRSFRFTDFFEDPDALGNFIDNFNLDVVEDFEHVGEIQNEKGEWVQPTFIVDGEKISSMIDTVLTVLKKYFEKYPDISTEEAIQVWNSFGLPKHALETEQIFDERTDMSKNRASKVFNTADGRKFYVSTQLRKQHMDKLISKANDWDIHITRLS